MKAVGVELASVSTLAFELNLYRPGSKADLHILIGEENQQESPYFALDLISFHNQDVAVSPCCLYE